MRYEKLASLLLLARSLAASAEGMTLDEMASATGEERRTIERMRNALQLVFPMDEVPDGHSKRFRIPRGLDGFFQNPTTDELLELGKVIEDCRQKGATVRADALEALSLKIRGVMKRPQLRRLEPDLEALLQAELIATQPGPRAVEDPDVFLTIRTALLEMKAIEVVYRGGSHPGDKREVVPFGILFGRMNYLIAADVGTTHPKSFRLDRVQHIAVLNKTGCRPADFNLKEFANASFGFFQDEQEDVVLHVLPYAVDDDFKNWRFHPNQQVEILADGSAVVKFRACGMKELAWHLFTWGDRIEVVAPVSLRETLTTELRVALGRHENEPRYVLKVP